VPSADTPASVVVGRDPVTFAQALRVWSRIGWLGFGGPAGQIALMHRELVERRRWISEPRFPCRGIAARGVSADLTAQSGGAARQSQQEVPFQ